MSKRKGTAIETPDGNRSKQASTTVDTPRLLNFEDDEAPRLPEIGSDPDGFKLSASEKKLIQAKLVNTRDPNTMQLTNNVALLLFFPFTFKSQTDDFLAALGKKAFGGKVSKVRVHKRNGALLTHVSTSALCAPCTQWISAINGHRVTAKAAKGMRDAIDFVLEKAPHLVNLNLKESPLLDAMPVQKIVLEDNDDGTCKLTKHTFLL